MFSRFSKLLRTWPRTYDAIVALFWALLSTLEDDLWDRSAITLYVVPISFAAGLALYWRRHFPIHVFTFQAAVVCLLTLIDASDPVPIAMLCGVYSLAAYAHDRRHSMIALVSFFTVGFLLVLATDAQYFDDAVLIVLMLSISWAIGDNIRTRREYQQSLVDRAERAEALRDSLAQQAVAAERTRIARDLHDVVAHSMSLMVVQAGAARRVAEIDPAASMEALKAIEEVGRNSLDEMRRLLGVLRGDHEETATAPQPDIDAIDTLADEFRAAGLPVEVSIAGEPRPLTASIELTAFRIVQEALTNTLKHAGPATAHVELAYHEDDLRVSVRDNGTATPKLSIASGQQGLIGMRERVAVFGGDLQARTHRDGGYFVSARIPLNQGT